jgi:hypothetical protein
MSLSMFGHIDDVFTSSIGTRYTTTGGSYVDGRWVAGTETTSSHNVNIQPLNMKEIRALEIGGERIGDYRKVWVNDGLIGEIAPSDEWTFEGVEGRFKAYQLDNRANFGRNYCKIIVARIDPS